MDIHNQEFKKSFRGYNEDEVDEFLDRVVKDYEQIYSCLLYTSIRARLMRGMRFAGAGSARFAASDLRRMR